ncbi:hypothetical protein I215_03695 [Galbibacter marinus]|uniref:Uncharacterized protein n=1 Tax=Galbibacter marinus TaxID=555500 RepID=K2Q577_9FLAO|nr:hypothetical protein [Galbibacter marinus]EKF56016.1 hypothetical protein I215_03695 [Galbibacter marinus]
MIESIVPSNPNDLLLLIFVLTMVGFILGIGLGRSMKNNKYKAELDRCQLEKLRLSSHINNNPISFNEDNTIKAIQTRGRSGISLEDKTLTPRKSKITGSAPSLLDFNYLGYGDEKTKDDLKKIDGIGPFIENKLNSIGIYTFSQLSKLRESDINTITELIEFFPGRIKRDQWKQKAEKLLEQKSKSQED